ncbi:MAG: carboxypeptidase-like regulatory domain-containing protein, partial [Verrucomicrobiales bacterium]|nr:carboxypeptidase-like regulatory domain-containing protein [Verrucomicrobiales bacterium]
MTANAVTLVVSPNSTSNTFGGMLTLNISGLTNGETVILERRLDANWDGVADANDPLTLRVRLTDGQAATLGGVTNLNVPGDVNPLGGAITARLNFYAPYLDQAVGPAHYWRVSSPSGRFVPVTASGMFTNTPFAQQVQGTVRSSGTNVPGAMVVALNVLADFSIAGATVANISANYTLRLPAGTYLLVPARPGYVTDMNTAPTVALGPGQTISTNLNLLPATRTLSGTLVDAADTNT